MLPRPKSLDIYVFTVNQISLSRVILRDKEYSMILNPGLVLPLRPVEYW